MTVFDDGGGPALYVGGHFFGIDLDEDNLAKWGCSPAIEDVPGCFGNPCALSALSPKAVIGQPIAFQIQASSLATGVAFLFLGTSGTDAAGCGLLLAGLGELLLSPVHGPYLIAQVALAAGSATIPLTVPADPTLVGHTGYFQGGASMCSLLRRSSSPPASR